ncbi:type IV secretion system protein [Variovorax sp. J22R24]|uniref:virB8 family protein n=1 Tax=Variovorax gracilis TaxID=3053502 RepID=UPI002577E40D|nr:type IV secretion system protein [Variovorax sp. J22R24]MDM0104717.1 type IV secretion system protein [Variovorax sp. J22R24]
MFNKKSSTPKIDHAVAKAVDFELTIADLAQRSERRAWGVAFGAVGMALILSGGYLYMLPLKEKVPFLVMADAYTGTSTVARLTDDIVNQRITASEAINRSNVAHFVLGRESYDLALTNLRDWTTVLTMSSPGVAAAYTSLHASLNPDSPYKVYGKDRAIRVRILSIVLLNSGAGGTPTGATVRFQRSLFDKQTGATRPMDSKIATLEFAYKPNLKMEDRYRIENPLGFQVTSYRVDSDYATAPPEEILVPSTSTPVPSQQAGDASDSLSDGNSQAFDIVVPPPPNGGQVR